MVSVYQQLNEHIKEGKAAVLWQRFQQQSITSQVFTQDQLDQAPPLAAQAWQKRRLIWHAAGEVWEKAEPFFPPPVLYIVGGGHISQALATLAAVVELPVVAIEDRPEYANRELFPQAREIICAPFLEALTGLDLGPTSLVVVATRGHRYDYDCLRVLLPKTWAYLGMVGSKKKVREMKELFTEEGFPPERVAAIHTPIGLPIGAQTPAEIGVSILAEIIAERRKLFATEDANQEVLATAAQLAGAGKGGVMVTIVKTEGHTPRKAGSRMLVHPDGRGTGSIGGGQGEAIAIEQALQALAAGENRLCHLDMTSSVASTEGMACGGIMDLLLENMALLEFGETGSCR